MGGASGWALRLLTLPAVLLLLVSCRSGYICAQPDPGQHARVPDRLSATGLYDDPGADLLAEGVVPYTPLFELWSDGATKRRWIRLPDGQSLDSTDMDFWQFPPGAKLWKEFTRDGVRIETRLMEKTGTQPEDWSAMAYLWTEDQSDALAVPDGVIDARGTEHDVPAAGECMVCHTGFPSRILGFSAIQLSATSESMRDLIGVDTRRYALPGSASAQAALGYLHANCAHCHNKSRPENAEPSCLDPGGGLEFLLRTDQLDSVQDTPVYRSVVGTVIEPGKPQESSLVKAMETRGFHAGMPPVGTSLVDEGAMENIRTWIEGMDP